MRTWMIAAAMALCTLLIPANAQPAKTHFHAGERLLKDGQWVFAAREFEHAVQLEPANRRYQAKFDESRGEASQRAVSAANILIFENKLAAAQTFLEEALRFDPKNTTAAEMMTSLLERMKDTRLTNGDVVE